MELKSRFTVSNVGELCKQKEGGRCNHRPPSNRPFPSGPTEGGCAGPCRVRPTARYGDIPRILYTVCLAPCRTVKVFILSGRFFPCWSSRIGFLPRVQMNGSAIPKPQPGPGVPDTRQSYFLSRSPSSASCSWSTRPGASVSRQAAFWVLGNGITSLMESAPVRIIMIRSSPNAIPP